MGDSNPDETYPLTAARCAWCDNGPLSADNPLPMPTERLLDEIDEADHRRLLSNILVAECYSCGKTNRVYLWNRKGDIVLTTGKFHFV